MTACARMVPAWQRFTKPERQIIRDESLRPGDGVCRFRCKIIMGFVHGKSPSRLASGGLCAVSQLDRVAHPFLDEGPRGIVPYVDEVDIHLNPKIGPDWMLRGQQKEAPAPGKDEKRHLAGAWDARMRKLTRVEGRRKTRLPSLRLLDRPVNWTYRPARVIHVILDNHGIHDSLQVRLAPATVIGRVKFPFLPPMAPITTASNASGKTCTPT